MVAGPSDPPHVPTGVAFPLGNPRACPPAPSPLLGGLRVCPATAAPVAPPWGVFSLLFLRLRAFSRVSGSFCVVPSPGRAEAPVAIQCPFLLPACPPLTPPPPFPWGRSLRESWRPMETVLCRGCGRYRCRQLAEAVSADALCSRPGRPRAPVCLGLHPLAAGRLRTPPRAPAPGCTLAAPFRSGPGCPLLASSARTKPGSALASLPLCAVVAVCVQTPRVPTALSGSVCGRVCVWGGNASRLVSTSAL